MPGRSSQGARAWNPYSGGPRHLVKWKLGLGKSGQYRSEQVTLINKTREAQAGVTSFIVVRS